MQGGPGARRCVRGPPTSPPALTARRPDKDPQQQPQSHSWSRSPTRPHRSAPLRPRSDRQTPLRPKPRPFPAIGSAPSRPPMAAWSRLGRHRVPGRSRSRRLEAKAKEPEQGRRANWGKGLGTRGTPRDPATARDPRSPTPGPSPPPTRGPPVSPSAPQRPPLPLSLRPVSPVGVILLPLSLLPAVPQGWCPPAWGGGAGTFSSAPASETSELETFFFRDLILMGDLGAWRSSQRPYG